MSETAERLRAPNGGVLPGERWPQDPTVAWTPETAFFALSAAASGDGEEAGRWLGWLAAHRTSLGAFPEKVDGDGKPRAAAPLGWTEAIVLLALAAKDEPLPTPPVPERAPGDEHASAPAGYRGVAVRRCSGCVRCWKRTYSPRWRPGLDPAAFDHPRADPAAPLKARVIPGSLSSWTCLHGGAACRTRAPPPRRGTSCGAGLPTLSARDDVAPVLAVLDAYA